MYRDYIKKIAVVSCMLFIPFVPFGDITDSHLEKRSKEVYNTPLSDNEVSFQWLGTAGFKVQKADMILLFDPYVTRVPLISLFIEPLKPNKKLIEQMFPRVDYIFVTDTHFDHFMDVPDIALNTGAKVIGSVICAKLLRICKVPESQIIEVKSGDEITLGNMRIKVAFAEHGLVLFHKPFYGDQVRDTLRPLLRVGDYVCKDTLSYHVSIDGFRFFVISGLKFNDDEMVGVESDVVISNVMTHTEGFVEKLLQATKPRILFPSHYDNFFESYSSGVMTWPIMDFYTYCEKVKAFDPEIDIITLDFFQEYRVSINDASHVNNKQ